MNIKEITILIISIVKLPLLDTFFIRLIEVSVKINKNNEVRITHSPPRYRAFSPRDIMRKLVNLNRITYAAKPPHNVVMMSGKNFDAKIFIYMTELDEFFGS